jgi:acyl carrier protein
MAERFRFRDGRGLRLSINRRKGETMEEPTKDGASIKERIRKIIIEHLDVDPEKVTDTANFIDDLGADSLDNVELVMAFEEEFDVEIPDDAAERLQTVGQAVAFLTEKLGANA